MGSRKQLEGTLAGTTSAFAEALAVSSAGQVSGIPSVRSGLARPRSGRVSQSGITLIELLITLAVLAVLVVAAAPSFVEYRQRAALRGATDQVISFWGDARFEAMRRNSLLKVGFLSDADGFCLGAAITTDPADDKPCDCLSAAPAPDDICDIGRYPSAQNEWKGVRVASATTLGDGQGAVVIDPKRSSLTDPDAAGVILLRSSASSGSDYRLNVVIERFGRAIACEPSDAPSKLPQYVDRRCGS
jgi:prepilin-type N-terminal cleavage/methylation domain-containing protein